MSDLEHYIPAFSKLHVNRVQGRISPHKMVVLFKSIPGFLKKKDQ